MDLLRKGKRAMVVYVCSPRSTATNGAVLRVDVGVVRSLIKFQLTEFL